MKKSRRTLKQIEKTKVSETVDLETLKFLFPYGWKKKVEELRKSRYSSVIFPK